MKKPTILFLLLSQVALATTALAVQMFDFDAQAIVSDNPGSTASVYGRIVNGAAVASPLPLDFANFEYTIVVTGLNLVSFGTTSSFANGTVVIYQDAATASDWADPASFSDGVAVLAGLMASFERTMFTGLLGSGGGHVDWTAGSMLDHLAPADRLGWPFLTAVSRSATQVLPGYSEKWDGKVEPIEDVVATEEQSWSELKVRFR